MGKAFCKMHKRIKHNIDIVTVPNGLVLLLMLLFYFRRHVAEKYLVGHRDLFDAIVNLLPHLELLMYSKPIPFLVGSTNVYGIIFYRVYLLPWITIPFLKLGDVILLVCCSWLMYH